MGYLVYFEIYKITELVLGFIIKAIMELSYPSCPAPWRSGWFPKNRKTNFVRYL